MSGFESSLAMGQDILNAAIQKNEGYGDYTFIDDMAAFVHNNQPKKEGTREIQHNQLVVFDGKVKTHPEKQNVEYLQMAMEMVDLKPKPQVEDAMFIEVADAVVIPVYLDKSVVKEFERLYERYGAEGFRSTKLRFAGVHVYNYSKGPAIVVESMAASR